MVDCHLKCVSINPWFFIKLLINIVAPWQVEGQLSIRDCVIDFLLNVDYVLIL